MPFAKYKNTPFLRYIVPIIPVGAKLAEGCKIKPENLGKIPGVRNPNGTWSGFGNFNRHISTNAIMDAFAAFYKHEGYTETVGILGREFICFDADTEYEAAIDIMRRNALFWLGETYERTRSNSKKFALIYRRRPNTPPIKKRRVSFAHALYQDDVQALEILGDGQQWLMEGKHKSGVLYEWKDGVRPWEMDVDKIPEIDNAQLDACLKAISAELALHFLLNPRAAAAANAPGMGQTTADRSPIGPEHPDRVEDLSLLAALLEAVPCDCPELEDRDEWIKFLTAVTGVRW